MAQPEKTTPSGGRRFFIMLLLSVIIPAAAALPLFARTSFAAGFHAGSTCEGCHTSHNSLAGQGMTVNPMPAATANPSLLLARDPSSTCLTCHERRGAAGPDSYLVSTAPADMPSGLPPVQMPPGGDFGWLKKTYTWTSESGQFMTSAGDSHGHNIIAADYGYAVDPVLSQAPGGTYPASGLQCTSCHDPHNLFRISDDGTESAAGKPIMDLGSFGAAPTATGTVSAYRMLGGTGYAETSNPGFAFTYQSPAAVSPAAYNRAESVTQTRVAYGSGMSEWCSNCHTQYLRAGYDGGAAHPHAAGNAAALGTSFSANYASYVKNAGDPPYLSLVPFETGDKNDLAGRAAMTALARSDDSRLDGPAQTSNVSCLTCHRAHASGWDSALRWNHQSAYIVYHGAYPGMDNGAPADYAQGRTSAEASRASYDKPASSFMSLDQGPLCHKCHP